MNGDTRLHDYSVRLLFGLFTSGCGTHGTRTISETSSLDLTAQRVALSDTAPVTSLP